jgi:hypothetical protein
MKFSILFFILCIISRGLDFLSTYMVTPSLKLEANLIAKKLGWKIMGVLNIVLCFICAYSIESTIIICIVSLLVTGNNFGRGLVTKGLGEEKSRKIMNEAISKLSSGIILVFTLSYGFVYIIIGSVMIYFTKSYIIFYIAQGVIFFGIVIIIHMNISIFKRKFVKLK